MTTLTTHFTRVMSVLVGHSCVYLTVQFPLTYEIELFLRNMLYLGGILVCVNGNVLQHTEGLIHFTDITMVKRTTIITLLVSLSTRIYDEMKSNYTMIRSILFFPHRMITKIIADVQEKKRVRVKLLYVFGTFLSYLYFSFFCFSFFSSFLAISSSWIWSILNLESCFFFTRSI